MRSCTIGLSVALSAAALLCPVVATPEPPGPTPANPTPSLAPDWTRFATPLVLPLTQAEGLPPGVVTGLAHDGDGCLWISTQGGLARWDGHAVRVFPGRPRGRDARPGGLPDGLIAGLTADDSGAIWAAFSTGAAARYDHAGDRLTVFPPPPTTIGTPIGIASNGRGGVWIDGRDRLAELDAATGTWRTPPVALVGRPARFNHGLHRTRDGSLWLLRGPRLGRLRDGRFDVVTLPPIPSRPDGASTDAHVTAVAEDHRGTVWFGMRGGDVGRVHPGTLQAEMVPSASTPGHYAGSIAEVRPGLVCVGAFDAGVVCVDPASGAVRRLPHDAAATSGALDRQIQFLRAGPAGLLWAGSARGVRMLPLNDPPVATFTAGGDAARDLSYPDVVAVAPAADGRVWFGLERVGLDLFDRVAGRVANLLPYPAVGRGHRENTIMALAHDPDGGLWISTPPGLLRLGPGERETRPVRGAPPGGLVMRRDGGDLWIGTNDGLFRLNLRTAQTRHFTHEPDNPASLAGTRINDLVPAAGGRFWLATNRGLDLFDPAAGTAHHFVHRADDPRSLPANDVWTLCEDRRGRLWVGTAGNGIGVLDPRASDAAAFHRIGRAQGLPNANIDKLLEDDAGRLWAATDDGLAVIDPDSLAVIRVLDRGDGQTVTHHWLGSGTRLADGTLFFGGQGGASIVTPDRLTTPPPPDVRLTDVRLDGLPRPTQGPIVLAPGTRGVQIEFAALEYVAPEQHRYAYRLEGFDPEWIEVDAQRRLAAYTSLAPGDYRLLVRAARRDGPWSATPLAVPVVVVPAWYQTAWFRAAALLSLVLVVFGLVRARTASLERRRQQLEREVADRTRALAETAEALRTANAELRHLANHDALTTLSNRRRFFQAAEEALATARRYQHPCAVFIADLDHFKQINDVHGHAAGDAALYATACCLALTLREADVGARYGGEELATLLPETELIGALQAAERFREALDATSFTYAGRTIHLTVSIGVAVWTDDEADIGPAIMRADAALYRAKRAGRNRVAAEDPLPQNS